MEIVDPASARFTIGVATTHLRRKSGACLNINSMSLHANGKLYAGGAEYLTNRPIIKGDRVEIRRTLFQIEWVRGG